MYRYVRNKYLHFAIHLFKLQFTRKNETTIREFAITNKLSTMCSLPKYDVIRQFALIES